MRDRQRQRVQKEAETVERRQEELERGGHGWRVWRQAESELKECNKGLQTREIWIQVESVDNL